jgi:DNA polymerase I-like protein with 3'-5' exonuclease and polymerase domains
MKAKLYDILLWEYIKNPWSKELWLNTIWERFFDYKMIELDKKNIFENLWIEIKINILWEQTYLINKIFNNQKEDNILKNTILLNIEIPLIEVLKNIELDW